MRRSSSPRPQRDRRHRWPRRRGRPCTAARHQSSRRAAPPRRRQDGGSAGLRSGHARTHRSCCVAEPRPTTSTAPLMTQAPGSGRARAGPRRRASWCGTAPPSRLPRHRPVEADLRRGRLGDLHEGGVDPAKHRPHAGAQPVDAGLGREDADVELAVVDAGVGKTSTPPRMRPTLPTSTHAARPSNHGWPSAVTFTVNPEWRRLRAGGDTTSARGDPWHRRRRRGSSARRSRFPPSRRTPRR